MRSLAFFMVLGLATRVAAGDAIKNYASLTLKDGRQFSAVQIVNYTATGVLVRHAGGATTFRLELLPAHVIAALHLQGWENDPALAELASLADKPAVAEFSLDASLADRPAVAEYSAIADRPAVAATVADRPFTLSAPVMVSTPVAGAAVASTPAIAAPAATPGARDAAPTPAGEGNMPEFFTTQPTVAVGAQSSRVTLPGRVVIKLPAGTFFLENVDVRIYPADLLARYLIEAKAKAQHAAQLLRDQAAGAAREGRIADFEALSARATRAATRFVEYLPEAPASARSDEFGNFTLQHDFRDGRIVAAGQLNSARAQWNYEWIGVAPQQETSLTEANATTVIAAEANQPKYAAAR